MCVLALLEPGCTWHYECREPQDLESCHLKAKCNNETLSNGYMDGEIIHSVSEQKTDHIYSNKIDTMENAYGNHQHLYFIDLYLLFQNRYFL